MSRRKTLPWTQGLCCEGTLPFSQGLGKFVWGLLHPSPRNRGDVTSLLVLGMTLGTLLTALSGLGFLTRTQRRCPPVLPQAR